jgi:hypothetical protein
MEEIADQWFMDLAERGKNEKLVASILLQVQCRTWRNTAHIIDFSQDYPRRQIQQSAASGNIWHGYVRCLRCGAIAWLPRWLEAASWNAAERQDYIDGTPLSDMAAVRYVRSCPGTELALGAAAILCVEIGE